MERATAEPISIPAHSAESRWLIRLSCAAWGHHVDNRIFRNAPGPRTCRCGAPYLAGTGALTRVRHTVACFLGHHTYERLTARDGHHEYVCVRCGHPLLVAADRDPYADRPQFPKKVRYLCGLLGHRVHQVTRRNGFAEYACRCGHSFLRREEDRHLIRHPLACVLRGHYIAFVERRAGYAEYVCRTCGHPFCFADAPAA